MYLTHFGIEEFPFSLTPNLQYFCDLSSHQDALNTVLVSLRTGEGFIKIIGEVGTGKTLLCRKLLDSLGGDFVTTYLPNPDLTPVCLRRALAKELGISLSAEVDQHDLLSQITAVLLEHHASGKRVVLLVDEAQALSDESLEALRLLTNLETETDKLLQIVLFGQPELEKRLSQTHLRQLQQRISFSHHLKAIKKTELSDYLCYRLSRAGYTRGPLFSRSAERRLYASTKGIPRLINIIAHKALMVSFGKGQGRVNRRAVSDAVADSSDVIAPHALCYWLYLGDVALLLLLGSGLIWEYHALGFLPWG